MSVVLSQGQPQRGLRVLEDPQRVSRAKKHYRRQVGRFAQIEIKGGCRKQIRFVLRARGIMEYVSGLLYPLAGGLLAIES